VGRAKIHHSASLESDGSSKFVQAKLQASSSQQPLCPGGTSEAWVCIAASLGLHHPYAKYNHHLIVEKSNIPSLLPTMQKRIAMSMAFIYEHVYSYCSERPPLYCRKGVGGERAGRWLLL